MLHDVEKPLEVILNIEAEAEFDAPANMKAFITLKAFIRQTKPQDKEKSKAYSELLGKLRDLE